MEFAMKKLLLVGSLLMMALPAYALDATVQNCPRADQVRVASIAANNQGGHLYMWSATNDEGVHFTSSNLLMNNIPPSSSSVVFLPEQSGVQENQNLFMSGDKVLACYYNVQYGSNSHQIILYSNHYSE
jgi:hypothetical protein